MIRKIKFRNFYSFRDEQVLDFTTNKKKSSDYFESYDGVQISKVIGCVGSNGSGKTNVMKLFGFLKYLFTVSKRDSTEEYSTGFKSYAFAKEDDSNFFIEFETLNRLCTYELTANSAEIIKETLTIKLLKKNSKAVNVFSRDRKDISINKKLVRGITPKRLSSIRKDVSVVAFIKSNYEEEIINEIHDYFDEYWLNVNEAGVTFSPDEMLLSTASIYHKVPLLKNKMEELVKNFDIGIDNFQISVEGKMIKVKACHKVSKNEYSLPIYYESRGTKALFVELLPILTCIERGSVLIIDEIESGLHPQAVNKIIQYIVDQLSKVKKQFIFASHSIDFLKKFDAQQIYLVEKEKNSSEVFRLDELDIRPDENFFAKYMTGSYGAFPKIQI